MYVLPHEIRIFYFYQGPREIFFTNKKFKFHIIPYIHSPQKVCAGANEGPDFLHKYILYTIQSNVCANNTIKIYTQLRVICGRGKLMKYCDGSSFIPYTTKELNFPKNTNLICFLRDSRSIYF